MSLPGAILAIDPGTKRVGFAVSDGLRLGGTPLEVWTRRDLEQDLRRVETLVESYEVVEILVGLPLRQDGSDSASTVRARAFAEAVADRLPGLPVRTRDETLTTWAAEERMTELGIPRRDWKSKVDAFAALILLEEDLIETAPDGASPPDGADAD